MSNIVPASPLALPDYAKKYFKANSAYAEDAGDVDVSDIGLNFLKIVQGMSKEAQPNWDGKGSSPLAVGTMILSRTQSILPVGTRIIPLLRKTRYIKWEGEPGKGNMVDSCEHANDPKITRENGLKFERSEEGEIVPPGWTKYVNFWFISQYNQEEPAILSFYRTSLKVAKKWTGELMRLTKGWSLPLFLFRYRLTEATWADGPKGKWPQFTVVLDSPTPEEQLPMVEKAYSVAQELYHATSVLGQIESAQPQNTEENATEIAAEIDLPPSNLKPAAAVIDSQGQVVVEQAALPAAKATPKAAKPTAQTAATAATAAPAAPAPKTETEGLW